MPLYLFDGERVGSEILVVAFLVCVPIFLCVKPCIACCCGEKPEHHDEHGGSMVQAAEAESAAEEGLMSAKDDDRRSLLRNTDAFKADMMVWEKILVQEFGPLGHGSDTGELFIH